MNRWRLIALAALLSLALSGAAQQSPKRIRVASEVQEGKLIHKVDPVYPAEALQAGLEGSVVLDIVIGTDGVPKEFHVHSGDPLLVAATIQAVRQWRYQPTTIAGEPYEVLTRVTVVFRLAPEATPPGGRRPDSGFVLGNRYTSNFFGFSYDFPRNWVPRPMETQRMLDEVGEAAVAGTDPAAREAVRSGQQRTYTLLAVFEFPLGQPVPRFNRSVMLVAEDVSGSPQTRTGRDFLVNLTAVAQRARRMEPTGEPVQLSLGGREFYRQDFRVPLPNGSARQAYLATVLDAHVLALIFTADTQPGLEEIFRTTDSLSFTAATK